MSFLRTNQPVATPVYTGLQLQTSSNAIPIAISYGVTKIAPNIIWTGGFRSNGGGGKGGGKGGVVGKGASNATYSAATMLAVCEGPVGGISAVFDNATITSLSSVASLPTPSFFNGATPQSAWTFLPAGQALGYNGTAIVSDSDAALGSAATLDSYSFEVQGVLQGTGFNGYDADPAFVIQDFLTNAQYGVGFPAASIAATTLLGASGDASYQPYCKAAGLALSPGVVSQETANSILTRWLQLTNTAAVWSDGMLKFIPYGDTPLTGPQFTGGAIGFSTSAASQSTSFVVNPQVQTGTWSFTPNVTPIYNLGDDDFIYDDGTDPVQVDRSDPYAASNWQELEISQRSNFYDATPIIAFDQNAIELYGLRIAGTVTAHEICDPGIAQTAAQLILQRTLYIRNHYTFKLSWEYCLLEPMDIVTLTDANLGLQNVAVRVVEIDEDSDGLLTLRAEEFPAGVASAVAYPVQQATSVGGISGGAAPGSANAPIIFEPPGALSGGTPQVWAAVSGGANWGGCNIYASLDDATYTQIGRITGGANQGVLTAALPVPGAASPDAVSTLSVSLAESDGVLTGTSASAAQNAVTLCIVDGELLSFETATLVEGNAYNLTTLYRGLYGTPAVAHVSGAPFARLDNSIFKFDLPPNYIGQIVYLKFQGFNLLGQQTQDLSACAVYGFAPAGAGVGNPIMAQLASGIALDLGVVTQSPSAAGDFGATNSAILDGADLGTAP